MSNPFKEAKRQSEARFNEIKNIRSEQGYWGRCPNVEIQYGLESAEGKLLTVAKYINWSQTILDVTNKALGNEAAEVRKRIMVATIKCVESIYNQIANDMKYIQEPVTEVDQRAAKGAFGRNQALYNANRNHAITIAKQRQEEVKQAIVNGYWGITEDIEIHFKASINAEGKVFPIPEKVNWSAELTQKVPAFIRPIMVRDLTEAVRIVYTQIGEDIVYIHGPEYKAMAEVYKAQNTPEQLDQGSVENNPAA